MKGIFSGGLMRSPSAHSLNVLWLQESYTNTLLLIYFSVAPALGQFLLNEIFKNEWIQVWKNRHFRKLFLIMWRARMQIDTTCVESPDLPALTTQSFLDLVGLAGSHWLSMSFLLLPQPEIKTQRESSGWRLQLFTLHRTEKGYPPLFTHSRGSCLTKCQIYNDIP